MKLPLLAVRIFVSHMPTGDVYLYSISESSGMRTLFFACHMLGALALGTFFSSGTGRRSKNKPSQVDDNPECPLADIWEQLGRLIVIGSASALLAALPVSTLEKVHKRSFTFMEYEECDEWKQKLRKWRRQDRFIWVCGATYCIFCAHFIMLFFASVVPDDQFDWIVSSLVSLCQELILLPLVMAVAFPVISIIFITISAGLMHVERAVFLARREADYVVHVCVDDNDVKVTDANNAVEVDVTDEDNEAITVEEAAVRKVPKMQKRQQFLPVCEASTLVR
eukprot:TRINITY_DN9018_c1_g1_i5.p1 TRINITY_DN9018_c1_g1~~TRINITY_DN9018_c1_g1_i5.p1  ORF type:complete len:280 (+),score=53.83 TRINITY_DN9018_c1_g1_i5:1-840(+)